MNRLPYIPEILPDELFYSWLGRVVSLNAINPPREAMRVLLGDCNAIPGTDLPTRLNYLSMIFGDALPHGSTGGLLSKASTYPYHRPFLSPQREGAISAALHDGVGLGIKTQMGRVANRFGASLPLQACRSCGEADLETHGVLYWRREQQLPGVDCCIRHGTRLVPQAFPQFLSNRHRFIRPKLIQDSQELASGLQIRFATLSADLLREDLLPIDPSLREWIYENQIRALGFNTGRGHIDFNALSCALISNYQGFSGLVHRDRLRSGHNQCLAWLRPLVRRPERAVHPICHLLLIGFLFGSVGWFAQAIKAAGEERLEKNKQASRENAPAGRTRRLPEDEDVLRDVTRSSSSIARSFGVAVETVVLRRRAMGIPISERRKRVTPVLIQAIAADLSAKRKLVETAERHNVSVSTVSRVRAGFPHLVRPDPKTEQEERESYRSNWKQTIGERADGAKAARNRAPATYAWLYRHDRTWLLEECSRIRIQVERRHRVDWAARDQQMVSRLNQIVQDEMANPGRTRLSKTYLLRLLAEPALEVKLTRLPVLQAKLEEVSETSSEFQKRRVKNAVKAVAANGTTPALWRVQRVAGLRRWTPELTRFAIEEANLHTLGVPVNETRSS